MAKERHLDILQRGLTAWNKWRRENPDLAPDLSGANLAAKNLSHFNLKEVNLRKSDLSYANLSHAILKGADLSEAQIAWATFANNDLAEVKGLEKVESYGPVTIGIDTLYKSAGRMPESFLRLCGVPDSFITFIPSLVDAEKAINFNSCFISYSHKDEDFVQHLYSRIREEGLRVWYAPETIRGGQKIHEQIFQAIQIHDRLLLVLSENSLQSEWVMTEIRRARRTELEEGRRKLFPIRLVDMEKIQTWECFDADSGKDLAIEVREYYIPDFSTWRDHSSFDKAFYRLIFDLRTI